MFNIFDVVINVDYTRCKADKDIMDVLVPLRKKKGAGGGGGSKCRRDSSGDAALEHALCRRCRGRLTITLAGEEDDGGDRGRVRGVWPHRIGGPRLRSCAYARRGCWSPLPHSV